MSTLLKSAYLQTFWQPPAGKLLGYRSWLDLISAGQIMKLTVHFGVLLFVFTFFAKELSDKIS